MTRTIITIAFLLLLFPYSIQAQNAYTWEDFVERMAVDDADSEGLDNILFEELYELYCTPLNLNTATEGDLSQLPFLTTSQCRDILLHIKTNGPMLSLGELMAIESLDADTRGWLRLFCRAGEVKTERKLTLKDLLRYSNQELTARTDVPFYRKAGYEDVPQSVLDKSPNKVYRGNNLYHSLRYRFASMNHLDIGIQMEKDPGERGVDYISGYALVNDIGALRTAAIGNYRVSFGQGLVVNTGSSFGKLMTLNSLNRMDRGIHRHSSTSETGYFTGAAATIGIGKRLQLSAFASRRKQDGTFLKDSSGISSVKTDGLHRTALEHSKKGNITVNDIGGNLHLNLNRFDFSFTAAHTRYSTPLLPKFDTPSSLYRYYNARGTDFAAYSLAYSYTAPRINLRGETAMSHNGALATVNSAQWVFNEKHRLTGVYRNYSARYIAINGRSFGENSRPQNEHGLFLGWTTTALLSSTLETYIDIV
ncbi:MAG: helix-hairpin-helix domain-containing protein, partial [Bacteroidaceae bacterium]|nr:helix-hairpin-helix domain-containing protein [Bacteroidaceae bacterium]